jgi:hypothetical protein
MHKHCHDEKTAFDLKEISLKKASRRAHEKGSSIEEPCAVKIASTVLKTSGSCEGIA